MTRKYVTTLYRGKKAVGCFITQNPNEVKERVELWNSHGEGHTAVTEEKEEVLSEGNEAIDPNFYLYQMAFSA